MGAQRKTLGWGYVSNVKISFSSDVKVDSSIMLMFYINNSFLECEKYFFWNLCSFILTHWYNINTRVLIRPGK